MACYYSIRGSVAIWEAYKAIKRGEAQWRNSLAFSIIPKPKVSQVSQQSVDFSQLFEIFNRQFEKIRAISAKFEGSKHGNASITFMSSVSEFIHEFKLGNYFELCKINTNLCSQ